MLRNIIHVPWILGLCFTCVALAAQDTLIRERVRLVQVPVSVTDRVGKHIDDLRRENFRVYDNGRPREFQFDAADSVRGAISLVVAIQSSGISAAVLAKLKNIGSMIGPLVLGVGGDAAIVAFDDSVKLLQDFTGDEGKIAAVFRQIRPGADKTAHMLDAVNESIRLLHGRPVNRRRVILLVSETRDRGSKASLSEVLRQAQTDGIAIYPATYSAYTTPFTTKPSDLPPPPADSGINLLAIFSELGRLGKPKAADAFARGTGGERLSFLTLHSLEGAIARFAEDLHNQYVLSFAPVDAEKVELHEIRVDLPEHRDLTVRARPAYWTAP